MLAQRSQLGMAVMIQEVPVEAAQVGIVRSLRHQGLQLLLHEIDLAFQQGTLGSADLGGVIAMVAQESLLPLALGAGCRSRGRLISALRVPRRTNSEGGSSNGARHEHKSNGRNQ